MRLISDLVNYYNKKGVEYILSEPNIVQLYALSQSTFPCGSECLNIDVLCGRDGTCIDIGNKAGLITFLPLKPIPSRYEYPSPIYESMISAVKTLSSLSSKPPLVHDYYDLSSNIQCRPRLGCRQTDRYKGEHVEPGDNIRLEYYKPIVCIPLLFSHRCIRLRRKHVLTIPWIVIGFPGSFKSLACLRGNCVFEYSPENALISLVAGQAVALFSRVRALTWLTMATLLSNVYRSLRDTIEVSRPALWLRGNTLIIDAHVEKTNDNKIKITLLLWNPSGLPDTTLLQFNGYRVLRAEVRTSKSSTELTPEYDRVRLVLHGYGLAVLVLDVKKIPQLLLTKQKQSSS